MLWLIVLWQILTKSQGHLDPPLPGPFCCHATLQAHSWLFCTSENGPELAWLPWKNGVKFLRSLEMEKSLFLCHLQLSFQKSTVAATYVYNTLNRISGKTNKLLRIGSSKFIHWGSRLRINFMICFSPILWVTWTLVGQTGNPSPIKVVP